MATRINDYTVLEQAVEKYQVDGTFSNQEWQKKEKVSVVVTTYNQPDQLRKQLLAISEQSYGMNNLEVVVVDDGGKRGTGSGMNLVSQMNLPFDIKYVWQSDQGFRLAKARNEALKRATYDNIISIDCDMIMNDTYVEDVMKWQYAAHQKGEKLMTVQDRGFVEPEDMDERLITGKKLGEVKKSPSRRFGKMEDWRHERYDQSRRMKDVPPGIGDESYFIGGIFSGGNCSFSKSDAFEAGLFDEEFQNYGAEDTEFGIRLHRHFNEKLGEKLFFVPVDTMAYHIEHGGKMNDQVDNGIRELFQRKVKEFKEKEISARPEVSVYIPAFNQEEFIEAAIDSVARQNFDLSKLEVVIGEDGSTDKTRDVLDRLQREYQGKLTIRIIDDGENHGMAENHNRTIQEARGKYIMQLDPDDELLQNAVQTLYNSIERNDHISLVFGDCIDRDVKSGEEKAHWSCEEFTNTWYAENKGSVTKDSIVKILREGMKIHAPRMFRRDVFFKTEGVEPSLQNAVDYDLFMKIVEIAPPLHIKRELYIYKQHENNTSKKRELQMANGELVKKLSKLRESETRRKEVYLVDESPGKVRTKHFDLVEPNRRLNTLYEMWEEIDNKVDTQLYNAIREELESTVGFFRWVNPEIAKSQLQSLLSMDPNNSIGNYFAATFHQSEGNQQEALAALERIEKKGPSALQLEQMIRGSMGIRGVA